MAAAFPFASTDHAARWDTHREAEDIAYDLGFSGAPLPPGSTATDRTAWLRGRVSRPHVRATERERALWERRRAAYAPRH